MFRRKKQTNPTIPSFPKTLKDFGFEIKDNKILDENSLLSINCR